jgi:2-hydroxychromene-2-carboxylate isomerase
LELKVYFDYKSPFTYLAMEPAFALPQRFDVSLRFIPFALRIKGPGQRSIYSEWKARYSYIDARRWANRRGGFPIRGPRKIYDSAPALIGGLFAQQERFFEQFSLEVFARFFDHRLEIDDSGAVAALIGELGGDPAAYHEFLAGDGAVQLEACIEEAHADHVFGVPLFLVNGEQFWGHDRIPLLEERLGELGARRPTESALQVSRSEPKASEGHQAAQRAEGERRPIRPGGAEE